MNRLTEKRLLQITIGILCCSPLVFGAMGMAGGAHSFGGSTSASVDSHVRYLSGIFFGLGVMAVTCLPDIEKKGGRFGWIVLMVVIGGLARLAGFVTQGPPEGPQFYAVFAELVATPLVGLWQRRLAARFNTGGFH